MTGGGARRRASRRQGPEMAAMLRYDHCDVGAFDRPHFACRHFHLSRRDDLVRPPIDARNTTARQLCRAETGEDDELERAHFCWRLHGHFFLIKHEGFGNIISGEAARAGQSPGPGTGRDE